MNRSLSCTVRAFPVLPAAEGRAFHCPAPRGQAWPALTILLIAACDASAYARAGATTLVDDADRIVAVDSPALRIVSLLPSVTELIVALDAADRLLIRTEYDADARLAHLPSFGRTLSPSAEALIQLRPDLVIRGTERGMGGGAPVDALGLREYVADVQTIEDIGVMVDRLGVLLGLPERADSLRTSLEHGLAAVRAAVGGRPRPTVLYLIWPYPPQTAGPGTFIDQLITAAGGRNVFADLRIQWPQVSLEEIVRRDPDYVVMPQNGASGAAMPSIRNAPGWRTLGAFREGHIVFVESDLFNRPGARVVEAARLLAEVLHPEVQLR